VCTLALLQQKLTISKNKNPNANLNAIFAHNITITKTPRRELLA
jgi:hypothetical protein